MSKLKDMIFEAVQVLGNQAGQYDIARYVGNRGYSFHAAELAAYLNELEAEGKIVVSQHCGWDACNLPDKLVLRRGYG